MNGNTVHWMKNHTINVAILIIISLLFFTRSSFAQELRKLGNTVKIEGKLYLVIDGKSTQIGEDVVVVKLKPVRSDLQSDRSEYKHLQCDKS